MKIEIIEPKKQKQINFPVTARAVGTKQVVRFYDYRTGIELLDYHGNPSQSGKREIFLSITDPSWKITPTEVDAKQPEDDDAPQWDGKTFFPPGTEVRITL